MSGFADTTTVSPEKTRAEIEATLRKYGADQFVAGWDNLAARATVMFRHKDRVIRFVLPLPDPADDRFTKRPKRHTWSVSVSHPPAKAAAMYEQAVRTVWRRLLLCIKAKLESVATGIETFEEAFLAQTVLPDNTTVGQWAAVEIPAAIAARAMPASLLALPPAKESP